MLQNLCRALAFGSALFAATASFAEDRPDQIVIRYAPVTEPQLQPIAEYVKKAHALEKAQILLKPLRLPRPLKIEMRGCQGEINSWCEDDVVTICYEFLDDIWKHAPRETTPAGVAPIDAVVGPYVDVVFHEVGHAIFDYLAIPLFGREEDAADEISVYLTLKFPKADAHRLILGNAYQYRSDLVGHKLPLSLEKFANEHELGAQRFFNVLCLAYGYDPKLFGDVLKKGYLPAERADDCEDEYKQLNYAFDKLIRPHIDQQLAKQIYEAAWLPPTTMRPPRRLGRHSRPASAK